MPRSAKQRHPMRSFDVAVKVRATDHMDTHDTFRVTARTQREAIQVAKHEATKDFKRRGFDTVKVLRVKAKEDKKWVDEEE
jgi:hypothetical protein